MFVTAVQNQSAASSGDQSAASLLLSNGWITEVEKVWVEMRMVLLLRDESETSWEQPDLLYSKKVGFSASFGSGLSHFPKDVSVTTGFWRFWKAPAMHLFWNLVPFTRSILVTLRSSLCS